MSDVRWGILGTGTISQRFAAQLAKVPGARFEGVASRQKSNADQFVRTHGGRAFGSYAQLCESREIDIVYVATPTLAHRDHCVLALQNGKAVLCEKPFTLSAQQASEVVNLARKQKLFCMEAMWMRFNPHIQELQRLVASKAIGSLQSLRAEVGWAKEDCEERSADGGGAMLTFGCYALSLAWFLLGRPTGYSAQILRNQHGLDVNSGILLHYPDTVVNLAASIRATTSNEILAFGSSGNVRVLDPFIDAVSMDVFTGAAEEHALGRRVARARLRLARRYSFVSAPELLKPGAGLTGEIAESVRCLKAGLLESPVMPLDESLEVHEWLDRIAGSDSE